MNNQDFIKMLPVNNAMIVQGATVPAMKQAISVCRSKGELDDGVYIQLTECSSGVLCKKKRSYRRKNGGK